MIEAVIFDLDGVLIDARRLHWEALNEALQAYGQKPITWEDNVAKYDGLPTKVKLEMLGIHDLRVPKLKQVITMTKLRSLPHDREKRRLMGLKAQIAVCTNAIRATATEALRQLGIWPDLLLSNEDVTRPKPDPEIYCTAMKYLGTTPETTLIVEDSPVGLEAAAKSGALVMHVTDPKDVTLESVNGFINSHTHSR